MKKLLMLSLAAMVAASVVYAQEAPALKGQQGQRPPMTSLILPRLVAKLALTADQQAKLDQAWTAFKTANPTWEADMKTAYENKDRAIIQKLRGIHTAAVDQWATCLTAEQKATLEQARTQQPGKGGQGAGPRHKGGQQAPPQ